jgi:GNAT superfamily N-acetyltransferase
MTIRKFTPEDAQAVSDLIAVTMRTTNIRDYPAELLEQGIAYLTPETLVERSGWMHSYVVCDGENIIGCGSIGPYWGREDESSLFTIFVLPSRQGQGVGRRIVETLESDAYALRARRIEVPASITGLPFYQKLGYSFKDGCDRLDEERLYRLEKFRQRE